MSSFLKQPMYFLKQPIYVTSFWISVLCGLTKCLLVPGGLGTHGADTNTPVTHQGPVTHEADTNTPVTHEGPVTHEADTNTPVTHGADTNTPVTHGADTNTPVTHGADTNTPVTHGADINTPVTHEVTDICPGVDYLLTQTSSPTPTFLQANASDCEGSGLRPTARQGVVYGVCGHLTPFCLLHVEPPRGRTVLASVHRLSYWCGPQHWGTLITLAYTPFPHYNLKCNHHSLDHFFVAWESSVFFRSIARPPVTITMETTKCPNFVVRYTAEYSGYIAKPRSREFAAPCYLAEWTVPSGKMTMISVQRVWRSCWLTLTPSPAADLAGFVKLSLFTPSQTRTADVSLYVSCIASADVLHASHLKIEFHEEHHHELHTFLKLYVSALPVPNQRLKLPSGLFNCSVRVYAQFQPHVDCNLRAQCEDGRDETEWCASSSTHCRGLVASRRGCLQVTTPCPGTPPAFLQYACRAIGGRPASVKTRHDQAGLLRLFKNGFTFSTPIGCVSGWHSVPFPYSMFRQWSDGTLIYGISHFAVAERYVPSRRVVYMQVQSMVLRPVTDGTRTMVCEVRVRPDAALASQPSLTHRPSSPALTRTQQAVFVCQDGHLTHLFLSCHSGCTAATRAQHCAFVNDSDAQLTYPQAVADRRLQHSEGMFPCDDGTTTLHHTFLCDFRQDCSDGSDESFCEHLSCSGFLCSNGQCVLSSQRCNRYSDCLDDSDEAECPDDSSYLAWFTDTDRKQWVWVSLDGTGYFTRHVMPADQICSDSHYPCQAEALHCLPVYTRCNGHSDCLHGEDEQHCEAVTCPGFYRCQSSTVCLHGGHLCDGWGQCPQRDDELLCDMTCPEGCLCQGHAFLCRKPFPSHLYPQLRYLDATGSRMSLTDFHRNPSLVHLKLSHCSIHNVSQSQLRSLKHVDLANNRLTSLNLTTFLQLPHLTTLHLQNNPLSKVASEDRKHIHHSLRKLDTSKTSLNILHSSVSVYLPVGTFLNVSFCAISVVGQVGFKTLPRLKELDVTGNPLTSFPLDLLSRSDHIERISTSNFRLCCETVLPQHRADISCVAPDVLVPSCSTLLPSEPFRLFFWLCCSVALVGNSLCFVASSAATKVLGKAFVKLTGHLQMAHVCMGTHVAIVVLANHAFDGKYIRVEKAWTDSAICKLAGFLSLLAGAVSVLVIGVITSRHLAVFCLPGQSWRFSEHATSTACVVTWGVGILLAAVPFVPGLSAWGLQGQSGLCRLALCDGRPSGPRFAWFTVTVGVNSAVSTTILAGQAVLYRRTPQHRAALGASHRSAFSSVHALRTLAVPNAACWVAVSLAAMMRVLGAAVFSQIHDTLVVFVLPLTSALHPLLYLGAVRTQAQQQQQEARLIQVLRLRLSQAGKQSRGK
ncbi:hypothetical protein ACOMHN_062727 [Nucella lapillus]